MNDGDSPACFVAYQQARLTHMHPIPVTRGNGRQCFCLFMPIWFRSRVTPQKWPLSDKDELALAVAAEANAQRSPKLEFLGLVNALEVLIEEKVRTQAQEQFIGRWKCEIDEATIKAQEKNEAGLADELAEIRKRLDFNSIQGGLRRIFEGVAAAEVLDPAVNVGFKAVDDLGRAVSAIYAVRSELTHSGRVRDKGDVAGSIRLQEAASVARYLVYCALFDRLK